MDFDARRVVAAEAQPRVAEAEFHRVAEWGKPDDFQFLAFEDAQVHEPLDQRRVALERKDTAPLAGPKLVEGWHGRHPVMTGRTKT
jgi:hypothetical protein